MGKLLRFGFGVLILILIISVSWTDAYSQSSRWTPPFRLSSGKGKADAATLTSDQYGYVHAFWTEAMSDDRTIIQYARFDGDSWSIPIDIYITSPFVPIGSISAVVDQDGILHILWAEGTSGPAVYTHAPASNALSAANWAKPMRIKIPLDSAELKIDSKGIFHVIYSKFLGDNPGVYYIRSTDKGITWSFPIRLDDDIPEDHGPRSLHVALDEDDGLHAAWYYVPRNDVGGNWVRYVHSLDGGQTWSTPFTIAIAADDNSELQTAGPIMTVVGKTVHIIWAAGDPFYYRHHRYSRDAGNTWSQPTRIMGDLNGQAFDGMAVDGAGRVHYVAQLRYPEAIYHIYWDEDHWTSPEIVYLIRVSGDQKFTDKVVAHHTHAAVQAGNHLVLTFNDPPSYENRRLFTMNLIMNDISEIPAEPTPIPEETPEAETQALPPTPTPTALALNPDVDTSIIDQPSPSIALWIGFIPTFMLLFGIIVYNAFLKGRR